jgi:hypothetical protein
MKEEIGGMYSTHETREEYIKTKLYGLSPRTNYTD